MARPENRWQGSNRGGFANADYDRLAAAFTTALEPAERTRLLVEITKLVSEELPSISLFFSAQAWVHTSDLRGPKLVAPETNMSWNIQEWEFQ
jgi:ABC-type transport system substrate-binding protein